MSITLAELRLQSRQRADMTESEFISDSELTSYINNSIAELKDILFDAYGSDYDVTVSDTEQTVATQDRYDLPDDFYELKAVELYLDGRWVNIERFNFNERNRDSNGYNSLGYDIRYRIVGGQLMFSPTPTSAIDYRLWYTPLPTRLVADADTLNDLNAYSEYVIVDAAIKMKQKQEDDVQALMLQKQQLEKRIRDKAQNRDAANAPTITDIYEVYDDDFRRRS